MEYLRRWGVADALREAAPLPVAWSQRVTFCESLSGRRITDFEPAFGLTAGRDDRFAESGQQVPQPVLEEVLRTHLRYRPGVELRLGHRATTLTEDADGVTVAVQDGQGDGYEITARYVLGCDGAGGVVREQAGGALRLPLRSAPQLQHGVQRARPGHRPRGRRAVLGGRRGRHGRDRPWTWTAPGGRSCRASRRTTERRTPPS